MTPNFASFKQWISSIENTEGPCNQLIVPKRSQGSLASLFDELYKRRLGKQHDSSYAPFSHIFDTQNPSISDTVAPELTKNKRNKICFQTPNDNFLETLSEKHVVIELSCHWVNPGGLLKGNTYCQDSPFLLEVPDLLPHAFTTNSSLPCRLEAKTAFAIDLVSGECSFLGSTFEVGSQKVLIRHEPNLLQLGYVNGNGLKIYMYEDFPIRLHSRFSKNRWVISYSMAFQSIGQIASYPNSTSCLAIPEQALFLQSQIEVDASGVLKIAFGGRKISWPCTVINICAYKEEKIQVSMRYIDYPKYSDAYEANSVEQFLTDTQKRLHAGNFGMTTDVQTHMQSAAHISPPIEEAIKLLRWFPEPTCKVPLSHPHIFFDYHGSNQPIHSEDSLSLFESNLNVAQEAEYFQLLREAQEKENLELLLHLISQSRKTQEGV